MNLCRTCGEDFGSVFAFDAHRVGKYLPWVRSQQTRALEPGDKPRGRHASECLSGLKGFCLTPCPA